jgi:hypothetical protein
VGFASDHSHLAPADARLGAVDAYRRVKPQTVAADLRGRDRTGDLQFVVTALECAVDDEGADGRRGDVGQCEANGR